ncbi:thiol-disulfide oxidoreductase [Arachidicoccus ginsenosidimutans]|uniref:thiol-disulfide oxidoreductase DCC family protein n=1 Tax=Arachidicoccus sp. BS20 TaxID=1850526 RepID=UPI0007F0B953|nr:thiol-disulfide oxidoreductase DCC family protein [Arachidicoccus sp. BS20]ANI89205.1 thiol-disulfide oxidoreductase [Arachidicoccus sp. BS20]
MNRLSYDIVLFDGVCNLCNGAVQFIIRHDKRNVYKFASLQSGFAKEFLTKHDIKIAEPPQSILLIRDDKIYKESSAALHIAQKLNGAWRLLSAFLIVPKFIRDSVYRFIARNRYKWFGKRESCMIPTKELRERFLD